MKRALFLVLVVAILLMVIAPLAATAKADGPWGYGNGYGNGYGYVFPGSGYNKVCMYSYWNCSYRFVPPAPVSGYYQYPYNTYYRQYTPWTPYYNPNNCTPGLYC